MSCKPIHEADGKAIINYHLTVRDCRLKTSYPASPLLTDDHTRPPPAPRFVSHAAYLFDLVLTCLPIAEGQAYSTLAITYTSS